MDILATLSKVKTLGSEISNRMLFTSFDDQQRTPLIGEDAQDKAEVIDYIHTYRRTELLQVMNAFTDARSHQQALPIVTEIYQEGVLVQYIPDDVVLDDATLNAQSHENAQPQQSETDPASEALAAEIPVDTVKQHLASQNVFVPFRIQDVSLIERAYYLFYEAMIRQGNMEEVTPSKVTRHYFTVSKSEYVTPNMLRLYLTSDVPLPTDDPGFAYRFVLTTLSKKDDQVDNAKTDIDIYKLPRQIWQQLQPTITQLPFSDKIIATAKKQGSIIFFEILKRLPEAQRDKLEEKVAGRDEGRYYTLRQLHKPQLPESTTALIGEVDIYIHEGSPGSEWAKSLKAGDIIYADNDYEETIKLMTMGQPLFICDETSMPSVAAMLERWQHETTPIVIAITNDKADFDYMEQIVLSDGLQDKLVIHYINTVDTDNLAQAVIDLIKAQDKKIDCAWGAIGKADFKPIKAYLREEHGLKGKINRIRAYWN
ncbi:siderophore-interacting protein [Psychrobacter pygoscelis]|uniref:siderophore-interacting protein n=1 Tax=Psychrobacter pygoscelis TaxID=2488563 RepID=UPI00103B8A9C|nr:SIP domain-containing protein [Psychrobacter pygoscelis]